MYKDNIIIKPKHTKNAKLISGTVNMIGQIYTITISGPPGTGKTETALEIKRMQTVDWKIFSLDKYYIVPPEDRDEIRAKDIQNNIGSSEIDWDTLEKDMVGIRYKIIEGLYASILDSDLAVFLDGNIEETYAFRKERFKEDPDSEFRKVVLKREYEEVNKLKKECDLIIGFNTYK